MSQLPPYETRKERRARLAIDGAIVLTLVAIIAVAWALIVSVQILNP